MTQNDLSATVAEAAKLTEAAASKLIQCVFDTIACELSVGEKVHLDGLGTFYTVKYPSEMVEDPPGSGKTTITLPTIEPDFDPDDEVVEWVKKQIKKQPELFATASDEEKNEGAEEEKEMVLPPLEKKESAQYAEPKTEEKAAWAEKEDMKEEEKSKEEPILKLGKTEKPLARASSIEFADVSNAQIDKQILTLIPLPVAKRLSAVPVDLKEGVLTVAMIDPEDFDALQVLRKETGLSIKPVLTTKDDIQSILDQYTGLQAELQEVIESSDLGISKKELHDASEEDLQDQTNENAPTAKIVFSLLKRAVKEHASDVHIEPYERKVVVRFRIDGVLQARVELPKEIQSAVISRLKILASLKIDEQRLPQDGRFSLIFDHRDVDFRLSAIPVVFGEKIVMRILDKSVGILSLEEVGMSGRGLDVLHNNMRRSHGMILVTGPTGSGKTTSLYAVLGKLMSESVNIITLEDPVEYRIESINQSQVHADIGYTFAAGLRSIVRQDPDIVMLGEIRDQETADMAIHAALTGHVVLSTLHTNDAAGAFPRLIDMKIEPFLITSSVHTVIAQRLARSLCGECKEKVTLSEEEMTDIHKEIERMPKAVKEELPKELHFYQAKGCEVCGGKGYKGRQGVFEVLDVSEPIRDLILKRSSGADITEQAIKEGMVTMVQDGIIKAINGVTTIEEVWRITRE